MKVNIIAVGKYKEEGYKLLTDEFSKRISKYAELIFLDVKDSPITGDDNKTLSEERDRILNVLPKNSYIVALDLQGKKSDSVEFSKILINGLDKGGANITFIIGGSLGLHEDIKKRADYRYSFSDMTFPHNLIKLMLVEQIYRGFKIYKNETYHK